MGEGARACPLRHGGAVTVGERSGGAQARGHPPLHLTLHLLHLRVKRGHIGRARLVHPHDGALW
jgi:hypothetical protein